MSDKPVQIFAIKTDAGYFITGARYYTTNSGVSALSRLFFDGKEPEPTFRQQWMKIEKEPTIVEKLLSETRINHRYELKDATMKSDKFPLVFAREEVAEYEDYGWTWKDEYSNLQSLYAEVSDTEPPKKESIVFEFSVIMEVDGIKEYGTFSYDVQRTQWSHEGLTTITPQNMKHQHIDLILFPDIVMPSRACKLTSVQSYKIVRQHVKENINPKVAVITSDYNFCFTVEKLIAINDPHEFKSEITNARGKSYKKRRYRSQFVSTRQVEVFQMTNSEDAYKGYTPIVGFQGKDQDDLRANIDKYLSDLMEIVNTPLRDCPKCKGMGVLEGCQGA